jgi:hypothetical protein
MRPANERHLKVHPLKHGNSESLCKFHQQLCKPHEQKPQGTWGALARIAAFALMIGIGLLAGWVEVSSTISDRRE